MNNTLNIPVQKSLCPPAVPHPDTADPAPGKTPDFPTCNLPLNLVDYHILILQVHSSQQCRILAPRTPHPKKRAASASVSGPDLLLLPGLPLNLDNYWINNASSKISARNTIAASWYHVSRTRKNARLPHLLLTGPAHPALPPCQSLSLSHTRSVARSLPLAFSLSPRLPSTTVSWQQIYH